MGQIYAFDGDGHVEEWEETFSDKYLDPEFRDQRPVVVETGEYEHDYKWKIGEDTFRIGGSPSSKDGVVSTEYIKMAKWRGPHESGEFHSAKDRLEVMDAEDTWLSVNYPTLFLSWPISACQIRTERLYRRMTSQVVMSCSGGTQKPIHLGEQPREMGSVIESRILKKQIP